MIAAKLSHVRSRSGSSRICEPSLVGLRYEKTLQAEPPKPMPPRNPSRLPSRARSPEAPIVIAPPPPPIITIVPPVEQHPALRTTKVGVQEGWKRDSGHAPAPTPDTTIREEEEEEEEEEDCGNTLTLGVGELAMEAVALQDQDPGRFKGDVGDEQQQPVHFHAHSHSLDGCQLQHHHHHHHHHQARRANLLKRFRQRSSSIPILPSTSRHGPGAPMASTPTPPQPPARVPPPGPPSTAPAPVHAPQPPPHQADPPAAAQSPRLHHHHHHHPHPHPHPIINHHAAAPVPGQGRFKALGLRDSATAALVDDGLMATLSFSTRGSIMFAGRRFADLTVDAARGTSSPSSSAPADAADTTNHGNPPCSRASSSSPPEARLLTVDTERESQKVRSLYGVGDSIRWEDGAACLPNCGPLSPTLEEEGNDCTRPESHHASRAPPKSRGSSAHRNDAKLESELAGGIEDWQDVDGADVDRYGFIAVPRVSSPVHTPADAGLSSSPRRRNLLYKKDLVGLGVRRPPSRKISARSLNTVNSGMSVASMRSSRSVMRQAGNLLPHNRDRRWMDEAGDMLTLSPGLQDAAEEAEIERISESLKRKEWERSEKWRKMARVVRKGGQGQGMEFEFDAKNLKLIDRTWKGIPDRWRATAWWSFLSASAEEHDGASADDIIASFHRLLEQASSDDVQIDLDVPRTISRHIMFRRRYRGGQRLLFRVLHALSIYFPETGYVQGMASLAATLLCYFDEERCFVMLVRMWQFRGLERLYRPGFEELMTALKDFNDSWLNKDVAKKMTELGVDVTAYGTRWYLTLFNLSIPFPAQLRVWDVFLLLGGLDVLHATSAALVQALGELLLDSDFENAMKALTSWIPVKDEDLLMKVARAEWRGKRGKKRI